MEPVEAVKLEYRRALKDLVENSKVRINVLTMLAEENSEHAGMIVELIENHIRQVNPASRLCALYLVDSIIKNSGEPFTTLFAESLSDIFLLVFKDGNEKIRQSLYRLRTTWKGYFPTAKLYTLDLKVKEIDPAWPVADPPLVRKIIQEVVPAHSVPGAVVEPPVPGSQVPMVPPGSSWGRAPVGSSHSIHVNPKFLKTPNPVTNVPAVVAVKKPPAVDPAETQRLLELKRQEAMMRQQREQMKAEFERQLAKERAEIVAKKKELEEKEREINEQKQMLSQETWQIARTKIAKISKKSSDSSDGGQSRSKSPVLQKDDAKRRSNSRDANRPSTNHYKSERRPEITETFNKRSEEHRKPQEPSSKQARSSDHRSKPKDRVDSRQKSPPGQRKKLEVVRDKNKNRPTSADESLKRKPSHGNKIERSSTDSRGSERSSKHSESKSPKLSSSGIGKKRPSSDEQRGSSSSTKISHKDVDRNDHTLKAGPADRVKPKSSKPSSAIPERLLTVKKVDSDGVKKSKHSSGDSREKVRNVKPQPVSPAQPVMVVSGLEEEMDDEAESVPTVSKHSTEGSVRKAQRDVQPLPDNKDAKRNDRIPLLPPKKRKRVDYAALENSDSNWQPRLMADSSLEQEMLEETENQPKQSKETVRRDVCDSNIPSDTVLFGIHDEDMRVNFSAPSRGSNSPDRRDSNHQSADNNSIHERGSFGFAEMDDSQLSKEDSASKKINIKPRLGSEYITNGPFNRGLGPFNVPLKRAQTNPDHTHRYPDGVEIERTKRPGGGIVDKELAFDGNASINVSAKPMRGRLGFNSNRIRSQFRPSESSSSRTITVSFNPRPIDYTGTGELESGAQSFAGMKEGRGRGAVNRPPRFSSSFNRGHNPRWLRYKTDRFPSEPSHNQFDKNKNAWDGFPNPEEFDLLQFGDSAILADKKLQGSGEDSRLSSYIRPTGPRNNIHGQYGITSQNKWPLPAHIRTPIVLHKPAAESIVRPKNPALLVLEQADRFMNAAGHRFNAGEITREAYDSIMSDLKKMSGYHRANVHPSRRQPLLNDEDEQLLAQQSQQATSGKIVESQKQSSHLQESSEDDSIPAEADGSVDNILKNDKTRVLAPTAELPEFDRIPSDSSPRLDIEGSTASCQTNATHQNPAPKMPKVPLLSTMPPDVAHFDPNLLQPRVVQPGVPLLLPRPRMVPPCQVMGTRPPIPPPITNQQSIIRQEDFCHDPNPNVHSSVSAGRYAPIEKNIPSDISSTYGSVPAGVIDHLTSFNNVESNRTGSISCDAPSMGTRVPDMVSGGTLDEPPNSVMKEEVGAAENVSIPANTSVNDLMPISGATGQNFETLGGADDFVPSKTISVDGQPFEVKYIGEAAVIERNGLPHRVYFQGPPRDVVIDGTAHMLAFQEQKMVAIDGESHTLVFGGPARELILGGFPLRGTFGGPPIIIKIRGVEHCIQLCGPPPEVKIDPEPDYDLYRFMPGHHSNFNNNSYAMTETASAPRPGLLETPNFPPVETPVKVEDQTSQNNPVPSDSNLPVPAVMASSASSGPLNVMDLLDKLVKAGLVPKAEASSSAATSVTPSAGSPDIEHLPQSESPPVPRGPRTAFISQGVEPTKRRQRSTQELRNFNMGDLRVRYQSEIESLYANGLQCGTCGLRFSEGHTAQYSQHLDWHFQSYRKSKTTQCRRWFSKLEDWYRYDDVEDEASKASIKSSLSLTSSQPTLHPMDEFGTEESRDEPVLFAPDEEKSCGVCGEVFSTYYDEEDDTWKIKNVVAVNDKLYHPICHQDAKKQQGAATDLQASSSIGQFGEDTKTEVKDSPFAATAINIIETLKSSTRSSAAGNAALGGDGTRIPTQDMAPEPGCDSSDALMPDSKDNASSASCGPNGLVPGLDERPASGDGTARPNEIGFLASSLIKKTKSSPDLYGFLDDDDNDEDAGKATADGSEDNGTVCEVSLDIADLVQ